MITKPTEAWEDALKLLLVPCRLLQVIALSVVLEPPLPCRTCSTRHRAEHVHHDFFDLWSSRVRDLKEFGVGHMMYFNFLSWMAVLFTALAVLVAAPNIAINVSGK